MIVRSIIAVVMGYAATTLIISLGAMLAGRIAKPVQGRPSVRFLIANFVMSFVGALLGGFTVAHLAPSDPFRHAEALALGFLVLGGATAFKGPLLGQPDWYPWTITVLGAVGILGGALVPAFA